VLCPGRRKLDVFNFSFHINPSVIIPYDANKESQSSDLKKPSFQWYLKDLFNLKTKTMKKISILTTSFLMMGLAMFVFI